jgi:endonuclease-3
MRAPKVKSASTKVKAETPAEPQTCHKRQRKAAVKSSPSPPSAAAAAAQPSALQRPTEAECHLVHDALATLHPEVLEKLAAERTTPSNGGCGSRKSVLDSLVGTILSQAKSNLTPPRDFDTCHNLHLFSIPHRIFPSQNTTDVNSHRAFAALKEGFPTWEEVRLAEPADVAAAIRSGGLADIKTARVQAILESLVAERGECTLEYLHGLSDEEAKAEMLRFKGVGAKTASCVLMFTLKRPDFPVDTHVWKIALALGWVPKSFGRDETYEHLNARVPAVIKHALHVLLVKHGKVYKNDVKELRKACRALEGVTKEEVPKEEGGVKAEEGAVTTPVKGGLQGGVKCEVKCETVKCAELVN